MQLVNVNTSLKFTRLQVVLFMSTYVIILSAVAYYSGKRVTSTGFIITHGARGTLPETPSEQHGENNPPQQPMHTKFYVTISKRDIPEN